MKLPPTRPDCNALHPLYKKVTGRPGTWILIGTVYRCRLSGRFKSKHYNLGGCNILAKNWPSNDSFWIQYLVFWVVAGGDEVATNGPETSGVTVLAQQLHRQKGLQWSCWSLWLLPAAWKLVCLWRSGWACISLHGIIESAMSVIHKKNAISFIRPKIAKLWMDQMTF